MLIKKKSSEFVLSVNSGYNHDKKRMSKMDTAETHILRAVRGYQCTEDMREFQIPDINTIIKKYEKEEILEHLERMDENQIPKLFNQYKPKGGICQEFLTKRWKSS
jgi:hypothetical protein